MLDVGDSIQEHDELEDLPIGTVICLVDREDRTYTKREDGRWNDNVYSSTLSNDSFSMPGYNKVLTLPAGYHVSKKPKMTLNLFKIQFRRAVLSAQRSNGVEMEPIERALENLGVTTNHCPLTPGQPLVDRTELPMHSLVECGDPSHPETYGVYIYSARGWTKIIGDRPRFSPNATILRIGPDQTEPLAWWLDDTDDEDTILDFKAKCWQESRRVKSETDWCGTVEQTMQSVGVTADLANRRSHGPLIHADMVATHPAGTLFAWYGTHDRGTGNDVLVFIRDDASRNASRTRRVFGYRPSGTEMRHTANRMHLLRDEDQVVTHGRGVMNMTPGTIFSIGQAADCWLVLNNSRVDHIGRFDPSREYDLGARGTNTMRDFRSYDTITIRRFGTS